MLNQLVLHKWDNSWDVVTHEKLQGYSKPCQCKGEHREDCIELLESPFKYKDYITQKELDKFNYTDYQ